MTTIVGVTPTGSNSTKTATSNNLAHPWDACTNWTASAKDRSTFVHINYPESTDVGYIVNTFSTPGLLSKTTTEGSGVENASEQWSPPSWGLRSPFSPLDFFLAPYTPQRACLRVISRLFPGLNKGQEYVASSMQRVWYIIN